MGSAEKLVDIADKLLTVTSDGLNDYGLDVPERCLVSWLDPVLDCPMIAVRIVSFGPHAGDYENQRISIPGHPARSLRMALFQVTVSWDDSQLAKVNPISNLGPSARGITESARYGLRATWALPKIILAAAKAGTLNNTTQGVQIGDVFAIEDDGPIAGVAIDVDIQPT